MIKLYLSRKHPTIC